MKIVSYLFVLWPVNLVFGSVCKREFEETVCENFEFSPEIRLEGGANKLIIKNARGTITSENLSDLELVNELKITGSALADIKSGALCTPSNLTSISLVDNEKLPKITENVLKNCQNLKTLYLDGPEVFVENGAFIAASDLQTLELNQTSLPNILESGLFLGLEALKSLTIKHSKINKINGDAFSNLEKLKFLILQANNIEEIAPETFQKLQEVTVLNLADNKLENLTWEEFKNLHSLRVLFLERNNFDRVDVGKLVESVPNLERIFLSYDKLHPENRKQIEEMLPKFNITVIYSGKPLE